MEQVVILCLCICCLKLFLLTFPTEPLPIWLKTEPQTNNDINKIKDIENIMQGISTAETHSNEGKCLSISYDEEGAKPFAMKTISCDTKQATVCKLENKEETIPDESLPRFPCLSQQNFREKRSTPTSAETIDWVPATSDREWYIVDPGSL